MTHPLPRRITSSDVAQLAQVSRSAVSRTFTAGASVAPHTRQRVLAAAAELGYRPASARADRPVAVVMANVLSPYFAELSDRLGAELAGRGLRTLFFISSDPARIDDLVRNAIAADAGGIILFSAVPSRVVLAEARSNDLPIVILDRNERVENASLVWIDSAEIGRTVATRMLAEGRRRPAVIATASDRSRELKAFADTMNAAGTGPCRWIDTGWSYADGVEAAARMLAGEDVPDAVFAASDAVAIGVLDGIRRDSRLTVPGDMSIIGFGDTAPSNWLSHQLSTVHIPVVALIQTAVSTLMARMASTGTPAPRIWLSCDLVERGTSLGLDDAISG
ncbi:LacI family DNA-binding transcriptional regulator [Sphingomonas sp. R86520]|uniref:LacI family DNA-binding transcriptional regulator n=1 Tax=Sphingomonas sp. R86520 TaxID=3093859 RepID=UPI0036D2E6F3